MDASKGSLGAILSQTQSDGKDKPVAFASHVLFPQETRYAIMELKTLAMHHTSMPIFMARMWRYLQIIWM